MSTDLTDNSLAGRALTSAELAQAVKQRHTMPLRIAVLLNAPKLMAQTEIQFVSLDETNPLGFEQALADAAELLASTQSANAQSSSVQANVVVNLADTLWLMPALMAAKNSIHPHALINGVGIAENSLEAINQALAHAKRDHVQPVVQTVKAGSASHKLKQLHSLVTSIATRQLPVASCVESSDVNQQGYWFCEFHQSRVAAFSSSMCANSHQAVILTQGTGLITAKPLLNASRLWLPIGAISIADLQAQLASLALLLSRLVSDSNNDIGLLELIKQQLVGYQAKSAINSLSAVVMASSYAALCVEVNAMLNAISHTDSTDIHSQINYKTPAGSSFTAKPLGENGLSFVYPGVGTVYPNMFKHLGHTFPALYSELEKQGDLQAMLQSQLIYATEATQAAQSMSLSELAISGVGASYMLTKLLDKEFNIKPKLALGYSMGEASMWASLNVWQQPHSLIDATQTSSLFTQDISGPLLCVRQDWQLDASNTTKGEDIVWNSFITRATPEELAPHLLDFPRAYIAIIQGDTCVVAGCEASCKAMLKQAGKRGIASNKVTAMHTPPAMQIIEQVKQFYHQPLMADLPNEIRFITATEAEPIVLSPDAIAQSIADTFCHQLDFTQLIAKAYQHGSRLFVEIGADRQTSTLIDKILASQLADKPVNQDGLSAQAIAVNAKGADESISLLKCLGQLLTHQVPMSLTPFIDSIDCAISQALARRVEKLAVGDNPTLSAQAPHPISEGEPH
ncbi:PfaB family protein [Shewanella livingstonensis]|uniref:PfaB family protein n=1 Tax=Shewanella livingstonensis TaxID=150120 RepID=A0A3G8LTI6_9GAMM|nr:PfaB family protein [Shewanella livingstonensis]AZG72694.1 PfaB family protein [Shewanella livingstonensis]